MVVRNTIITEKRTSVRCWGSYRLEAARPQHVDSVVSKVRKNMGLIEWTSRHFKSMVFCATLYASFVRSHLEYASGIGTV